MWTTASIRILFLFSSATEQSRRKTNICCGQGCVFSVVWSRLTRAVDNFPRGLEGQTPPLFTKDKRFWRGPRPSALTVNTRVSGTNVTCDWWGTSGIKGQEGNHRGTLWKEANSCTQTHKHAHFARTVQACALIKLKHLDTRANSLGASQRTKLIKIRAQEIQLYLSCGFQVIFRWAVTLSAWGTVCCQ